jgi:transaldolase
MTMAPNPNLQRLSQTGVSIWLETLSRGLLQTGGFAGLIDDYGVTGATSNPAIFAKAITDSGRYDGQLREQVASGERDTRELFFSLALDDIRAAARLLNPAYEHSQGNDGFISFECTPDLADDTGAQLWQSGSPVRACRARGTRRMCPGRRRLAGHRPSLRGARPGGA